MFREILLISTPFCLRECSDMWKTFCILYTFVTFIKNTKTIPYLSGGYLEVWKIRYHRFFFNFFPVLLFLLWLLFRFLFWVEWKWLKTIGISLSVTRNSCIVNFLSKLWKMVFLVELNKKNGGLWNRIVFNYEIENLIWPKLTTKML